MLRLVPVQITDTEVNATRLRRVPAPVTDTEVDAAMLQLVPAPVKDTGMDTTILTNSEDECKAQVHIHQTPLVSLKGKAPQYTQGSERIGATNKCRYNQRSQCEFGKSNVYMST